MSVVPITELRHTHTHIRPFRIGVLCQTRTKRLAFAPTAATHVQMTVELDIEFKESNEKKTNDNSVESRD